MAMVFDSRATRRSPRWLWGLLVLVLILTAAYAALRLAGSPEAATVPAEISVQQAAEKRQTGAFILDVRQPDEWNAFHIPDAALIPLDQLQARIAEVPQNTEIIVVCRTGSRSAQGRDLLRAAGYPTVTSMAGGMTEWRAAGLPTMSGP
ncbi:MAG TPA: rhodanese-like domain-containing protein [Anaerolineaceae bacterium]|nr:rhodanese-like domain-containing protein [Anaerolineaceae bacterium]